MDAGDCGLAGCTGSSMVGMPEVGAGREALAVGGEQVLEHGAPLVTDAVRGARSVPNPWGRFGSPEHQAEIGGIIDNLMKRGFDIKTEQSFAGRFIDVAGTHPITGEREWYQV